MTIENPQITQTYVGREFMWDFLSEVDYDLLRQNRYAAAYVLENPDDFPKADLTALERKVAEIDSFYDQYPERLGACA
jgi:hypothetical protein